MTDMSIARIRELNTNRTPGEWEWKYCNTTLAGARSEKNPLGDVLDISHHGECGCRSACELEVDISDDDLEFIANAPGMIDHLLSVVDEVKRLHTKELLELDKDGTGNPIFGYICWHCNHTWPCGTIRALGEEQ